MRVAAQLCLLASFALASLALAGGCRGLAGYGLAKRSPSDGTEDRAIVPDATFIDASPPVLDVTPRRDASVADTAKDAAVPADLDTQADGPPPVLDTTFTTEAGLCSTIESIVQTTPCTILRANCFTAHDVDGDCDGLGDKLDPDPATCNALLYVEPFSVTPTDWVLGGAQSNGCHLVLPVSSSVAYKTKLPTGNNLWMIGFTYTSDPTKSNTSVTLSADAQTALHYRFCKIGVSGPQTLLLDAVVKASAGTLQDKTSASRPTNPLQQGGYYTLMMWGEGQSLHCTLYDAAGSEVLSAVHTLAVAFTAGALFKVHTANLSIDIDQALVFARAP